MTLFKIATDGQGFTQTGSVIEFQHRNAPGRVLGQKGGRQVFPRPQIDLLIFHLDPLLRQKHSDPTGIGGSSQLINLHVTAVDEHTVSRCTGHSKAAQCRSVMTNIVPLEQPASRGR